MSKLPDDSTVHGLQASSILLFLPARKHLANRGIIYTLLLSTSFKFKAYLQAKF